MGLDLDERRVARMTRPKGILYIKGRVQSRCTLAVCPERRGSRCPFGGERELKTPTGAGVWWNEFGLVDQSPVFRDYTYPLEGFEKHLSRPILYELLFLEDKVETFQSVR